jgi:ArsR family transcriptional regulator, arsenate/arsenite/antimonite-responsive transcriptional repressor / arsenate reductase (thioredoxin)
MDLEQRARLHAALGDPRRLQIVDALRVSDRCFTELAVLTTLPGNAFAHHLDVLERSGLIERHESEGDRRRRYVRLRPETLAELEPVPSIAAANVLFVCSHNSARSQFAAALWRLRTGTVADSAGTEPAPRVHPMAVRTASSYGVDLSSAIPKGYDAIRVLPDLVVSVCDRAFEAGVPFATPSLHWSVPDPVASGTPAAFSSAFADVARRIDLLAAVSA